MSQKFRHFIGYLSISDFLKQIPPRNTLIILFFFYTHQSLSMKTKRFGAGCSSLGSWLKINGSVLRDQKVWKKTKELNMCRIYICFEKSLIDKFLRTLKKKISYLTYLLNFHIGVTFTKGMKEIFRAPKLKHRQFDICKSTI